MPDMLFPSLVVTGVGVALIRGEKVADGDGRRFQRIAHRAYNGPAKTEKVNVPVTDVRAQSTTW
ncbi:MAG: hypothetical protein R2838_06350 [Caldilineaceae bacterium]